MSTISPYIKEFEEAVLSVIPTMTMTEIQSCDQPYLKNGHNTYGTVTGVIGLAGPGVNANMMLSFESSTVLDLLANMLGERFEELNDEVLDAVGEFTNIVCGDVKRRLALKNIKIDMSTPLVISGADVRVRDRVTRAMTVLTFKAPTGKFTLETNLAG